MKSAKFVLAAAAAATFGLASTNDALAQACIGTPTVSGQRALAVGASFPEWGTNYGVGLNVNLPGPVSFNGAYSHSDVTGAPNMHAVGARAAYRLPGEIDLGPVQLNTCPTAAVAYSVGTGAGLEQTHLTVPLGVGVGTRIDVGQGMALTPYVMPEFYLSRTSRTEAGQRQVMNSTGLRATVGTALDFGPFFAGVDYSAHYQADPRAMEFEVPFLRQGTGTSLGVSVGVKF